MFQNIRNLGANGNQPLITNQNDFQFFDNVTWLKGKHTMKAGGSLTLRSREILNADTIVGNFEFNNNQTSNCAGLASGCTINADTGFDVASFLLGYADVEDAQPVRRRDLHRDSGPSTRSTSRTTSASSNRLTINAGLRWDVYVPWVEKDDRQSNFDDVDRPVRRRVRQRGRSTASRSAATCRPTRRRTSARASASPTTCSGDGRTIVRGGFGVFWNFTPGGTSSSKAQNPPFLQSTALTTNVRPDHPARRRTACRRRRESTRTVRRPAPRGRSSTSTSATPTRTTGTSTSSRQFGANYMVELAYVGSRGRQMMLKGDPNQAPPVVGVTDQNVNRPYAALSPALRTRRPGCRARARSTTTACCVKFQRRFGEQLLVPELLHLRPSRST